MVTVRTILTAFLLATLTAPFLPISTALPTESGGGSCASAVPLPGPTGLQGVVGTLAMGDGEWWTFTVPEGFSRSVLYVGLGYQINVYPSCQFREGNCGPAQTVSLTCAPNSGVIHVRNRDASAPYAIQFLLA